MHVLYFAVVAGIFYETQWKRQNTYYSNHRIYIPSRIWVFPKWYSPWMHCICSKCITVIIWDTLFIADASINSSFKTYDYRIKQDLKQSYLLDMLVQWRSWVSRSSACSACHQIADTMFLGASCPRPYRVYNHHLHGSVSRKWKHLHAYDLHFWPRALSSPSTPVTKQRDWCTKLFTLYNMRCKPGFCVPVFWQYHSSYMMPIINVTLSNRVASL